MAQILSQKILTRKTLMNPHDLPISTVESFDRTTFANSHTPPQQKESTKNMNNDTNKKTTEASPDVEPLDVEHVEPLDFDVFYGVDQSDVGMNWFQVSQLSSINPEENGYYVTRWNGHPNQGLSFGPFTADRDGITAEEYANKLASEYNVKFSNRDGYRVCTFCDLFIPVDAPSLCRSCHFSGSGMVLNELGDACQILADDGFITYYTGEHTGGGCFVLALSLPTSTLPAAPNVGKGLTNWNGEPFDVENWDDFEAIDAYLTWGPDGEIDVLTSDEVFNLGDSIMVGLNAWGDNGHIYTNMVEEIPTSHLVEEGDTLPPKTAKAYPLEGDTLPPKVAKASGAHPEQYGGQWFPTIQGKRYGFGWASEADCLANCGALPAIELAKALRVAITKVVNAKVEVG